MIDVERYIDKEDLDLALKVIRSDSACQKTWSRLDGHRQQAEYLLRAAAEARRIRDGETS